jgi:pimeloyl-ACP methyl ester carboxylesterase
MIMALERLFLAAVLLAALAGCSPSTPAFRDEAGRVVPGSIASMEDVVLGGLPQRIWLRGLSDRAPILVLLHGGPGANEMPLFRRYDADLERHFLVVYWEQRGTGRSYRPDIPPQTMTIDRFVMDLDELVDRLRWRFGAGKVALLGHSWGSALGVLYAYRHPDKVSVYAGTGQIADMPAGEKLSYDFALAEAHRRENQDAVEALEAIGPPPHGVDGMLVSRRWVERFGGSFAGDLSTGWLIWNALKADEANLVDIVKFGQGNRFSLEHLSPEQRALDLADQITELQVPVVFLLGRHDRQIPAELAAGWFERMSAPVKRLVWFEQSAHNPPFEEPERFVRAMVDIVLPLARQEAK